MAGFLDMIDKVSLENLLSEKETPVDAFTTKVNWFSGVAIRDPEMAARVATTTRIETPADGILTIDKMRKAVAAVADAPITPTPLPVGLKSERDDRRHNPFEPEPPKRMERGPDFPRLDVDPGMQVWCEGELIGWLNVDRRNVRGEFIEFSVADGPILQAPSPRGEDDPGLPVNVTVKTHRLAIQKRSVRVSKMELAMARDADELKAMMRRTHKVASDAEIMEDAINDCIVYRWRAINATVDESEQIFDLPNFTPNPHQR